MQPVSPISTTTPFQADAPFHSLGLWPSVLCLPHRHSPYHDWAPEPHVNLYPLHGNCPPPAQAPTLCAMSTITSECSWSENLHADSHGSVLPHSSYLDSDTLEVDWPTPILSKWMCFLLRHPRTGGAACGHLACPVWAMIPETRQSPSHARMYIPPCSGIDIIQKTVPCRDWPSLPDTSCSYARLPWDSISPNSGCDTMQMFISLMPFSTPPWAFLLGFPSYEPHLPSAEALIPWPK